MSEINEPITDETLLYDLRMNLLSDNFRNYLLLEIPLNTGLSINEVLDLKVKDLKNKSFITLKDRTVKMSNTLIRDLKVYLRRNKNNDEYIFKSRKGYNKPIGINQAYKILKKAGEEVGIKSLGSEKIRKTYSYMALKTGMADLEEVTNNLGFKKITETLIYLKIK